MERKKGHFWAVVRAGKVESTHTSIWAAKGATQGNDGDIAEWDNQTKSWKVIIQSYQQTLRPDLR